MALKTGRLGYLGLGIESTAGTPVAATTTLPFIANTIKGKHDAIEDIAARGSRAQNYTSVLGKQWGEGELTVNADTLQLGYLLKLATGNETVNTVVASQVFDHLFYTTVSGNLPLTATMYNNQGVDTQQFASMAIDKLTLEVKDSLMTAKAGFKGFFPTSGSFTNTTVSGTLLDFTNYTLQLGSSLITAAVASASPVTDFTFNLENNAELIYESGSNTPTRVYWKQLKITGSFTRFFETTTDRDNYYNLNKQSLILTCSGNALPSSNVEKLTINLARLEYSDSEITTGLEDFFAIKTTFMAEFDVLQGKQYDIILRNYKSSAYS